MNNKKSIELYARAKESIPGGVNSPVRAFKAVGMEPLFAKSAKGQYLYDADNNRFIDYIGAWGPMLLGHNREEVVEAVKRAAEEGMSFGMATEKEVELAELVKGFYPSIEMLRLTSSGTEAVMAGVRLARAATGRKIVIKFEGCYHGHSDSMLIKAGSGLMTGGIVDSNGITPETFAGTVTLGYNDSEGFVRFMAARGREVAAVIVEPVAANMGIVMPEEGFLEKLRSETLKYGALLIFDEVITGFRLAPGGAQEYFGISADITVLGKILGGGMPVGGFGGRRELMEMVAPSGNVYHAGTMSGNNLCTAAGIAALSIIKGKPELYMELERKRKKITGSLAKFGGRISVSGVASLFTLFFTKERPDNMESAGASDTTGYGAMFRGLIERGILFPPAQFEACFISAAHTDDDIEATIAALEEALG